MNFESAQSTAHRLRSGLETIIQGRTDTINLIITALLADGHVLLEDYPGSGKTTLAKTLGKLIDTSSDRETFASFRRIQFTPDLLPGDVLGVTIFEPQKGSFRFIPGPIFSHIVLADEINRTGPKVQSAFLECMAEKQVTIDNETRELDPLFFVLGTQNPLDMAGTYPLPLVQLDRFLFKIPMPYVTKESEIKILEEHAQIVSHLADLKPVCTRDEILESRKIVSEVFIAPAIRETIVDILQATRNSSQFQYGASTRCGLLFQRALQAWAIVSGRDFVSEEDLLALAEPILLHRLRFTTSNEKPAVALKAFLVPFMEKLISKKS